MVLERESWGKVLSVSNKWCHCSIVVVHLQKRGFNGCSGTFWYFWKCDDVYQRSE